MGVCMAVLQVFSIGVLYVDIFLTLSGSLSFSQKHTYTSFTLLLALILHFILILDGFSIQSGDQAVQINAAVP